MVLERPAPVGVLALDLALDEHAPGAVEHRDALAEDGFESCARVRQSGSLLLPRENRTSRKAGLFRRLVTRSPSCLSKLSGSIEGSSRAPAVPPRNRQPSPRVSALPAPAHQSAESRVRDRIIMAPAPAGAGFDRVTGPRRRAGSRRA